MSFYTNNYRGFSDINIIQFGYRRCAPGFAPEYHVRDTYLIHYVYRGSGYLDADGHNFSFQQNQAFVIFPGQMTNYFSSKDDPATYGWVEFYGNKSAEILSSAGITPKNPIFNDSSDLAAGLALKNLIQGGVTNPFDLSSKFYAFASALLKDSLTVCTNRYVDMAINYIHYRNDIKVSVSEIAQYVNISTSLLSHLFTDSLGISPKQYVIEHFMSISLSMLKNKNLSIKEISSSIGYSNSEDFSKMFKRRYGISPTRYRKSHGLNL